MRFQGVVAFNDRDFGFVFVDDGIAAIRIRSITGLTITTGRRVAVSGRTGSGQDAYVILDATLLDLGPAPPPKPRPISAADLTSERFDGRLVSLAGVLQTFQQGYYGQARAEMNVGGPHVVIFIHGGTRSRETHEFEDAEVIVTGLLSSSAELDHKSFTFSLLVPPGLTWIRVVKAPPDLRTLPLRSVSEILNSPKVPAHRVRLKGILPLVGDPAPSLSDVTGTMLVTGEMTQEPALESLPSDRPVDVAAFVGVQGTQRVLTGAFVFQSQSKVKPTPLTKADSLLSLTASQSRGGRPISLDAVVTFYDARVGVLFGQDRNAGFYINAEPHLSLRAGDHILLSGVSAPGGYSPVGDDATIRVVGRLPLPVPSLLSPAEVFQGGAQAQWVELDGIIRRVGWAVQWFADAAWGSNRYTIRLSGESGIPASWIDAHVRVRGVCDNTYNSRRQFAGAVMLFVPGLDQITVVDRPPSDPYRRPVQQIKSLLQYSPSGALGHRVWVRGIVTVGSPQGPTWIQDSSAGLMIRNHEKIQLSSGDLVDVAGFVTSDAFSPQLEDAQIAKVRVEPPLQPVPISGEEGLSGAQDSKLVQIDAKLLNQSSNGNEMIMLMRAGRYTFTVHGGNNPPPLELGSVLRVTGICSVILKDLASAKSPSSFEIFARSPSDFHQLQSAPWLTLQRAAQVFAISALFIAATLTWVFFLRRRVRLQTQVIAQKLSEVESLKEAAETANRAKSSFLANMSHEIRTPLTALLGYTQLVMRDKDLRRESKAHLSTVGRSGEHLLGLINEVLDLSKIEAGRVELAPTLFDARLLFEDLDGMFRLRAEAKNLQFEMYVTGAPDCLVLADEGKVRQILINLLGNAVKFTEAGRVNLRVEFEPEDSNKLWLSVSVEDTGNGITAEGQAKLFEAFSQLAHTQGGSGLGLVISRKFARMMGGDITIPQSSPQGTTFRLQIPLEVGEPTAVAAPTEARRVIGIRAGTPPLSILVVDDQPENRDWLLQLLGSTGFIVREAEDGAKALLSWEEWHPKLIVMDVRMPVMDGLEATRRIRATPRGSETAILIFTASALSEDRRLILESGANDFLPKPCVERDLFEKIATLLGIQYEYEETAGEEARLLRLAARIDTSIVLRLPPDLSGQLRDATSNGDKTLLDTLIVKVRETADAECADILQQLSDNYEYDALTKLLKEV